jgi:hypothetical protein
MFERVDAKALQKRIETLERDKRAREKAANEAGLINEELARIETLERCMVAQRALRDMGPVRSARLVYAILRLALECRYSEPSIRLVDNDESVELVFREGCGIRSRNRIDLNGDVTNIRDGCGCCCGDPPSSAVMGNIFADGIEAALTEVNWEDPEKLDGPSVPRELLRK